MPSPERKYIEARVKTASPEELTVIVYDVLVQSAQKGIETMRETPSDIQLIHDHLRRAQQAVATLMGSLNFEIGGELAHSLFRMYSFWHHELVMANMEKSAVRIERLLTDFKEFRETWAEANRRWRAAQQADGTTGVAAGGGFTAVG
jgi:flagellar secretion chaperone FliS